MTDMIKKALLLIACMVCLTVSAQEPRGEAPRPRMTPEEYQTRQKEFIARHAELTEEESEAFFPLYFELQDKKHKLNGQAWKQVRAVRPQELTEEDCNTMIDALADTKIECANLEKQYLVEFKKILPAKKLMRVQMAEDRFQRELLRGMQQGQGAGKRPGQPR